MIIVLAVLPDDAGVRITAEPLLNLKIAPGEKYLGKKRRWHTLDADPPLRSRSSWKSGSSS
ncbi:hypothetical protein [Bradyrhizobium sp. USDA 3650]